MGRPEIGEQVPSPVRGSYNYSGKKWLGLNISFGFAALIQSKALPTAFVLIIKRPSLWGRQLQESTFSGQMYSKGLFSSKPVKPAQAICTIVQSAKFQG